MILSEMVYYVKLISIIQLVLILLGMVFLFCVKIVFKTQRDRKIELNKLISSTIQGLLTSDDKLSLSFITLCKRHVDVLIDYVLLLEKDLSDNPKWLMIKNQLIDHVLKPKASVLARSNRWLNQYLAVQCYAFGIDLKDEFILLKLIHHNILLVCLGAAQVVFKYPTARSVDVLIDVLAKGRRLNQSFFIEVLTKITVNEKKILSHFFTMRLMREEDPFVRSFCYRMMMHLTASPSLLTLVKQDVLSNYIELKLAAINYLSIIPSVPNLDFLIECLDDEQFEVRAVVVKLFRQFHHETVIPLLENKLTDPVWWVRVNAAESLLKIGKKGIAVLQRQSLKGDRFAYETAQKMLITLHQTDKDI